MGIFNSQKLDFTGKLGKLDLSSLYKLKTQWQIVKELSNHAEEEALFVANKVDKFRNEYPNIIEEIKQKLESIYKDAEKEAEVEECNCCQAGIDSHESKLMMKMINNILTVL